MRDSDHHGECAGGGQHHASAPCGARAGESSSYGQGLTERAQERYFHALENARRESRGLQAIPDVPYTEEDYHDDLDTLEHTIPVMRAEPGCQTGKATAFLDEWEREVREQASEYERSRR